MPSILCLSVSHKKAPVRVLETLMLKDIPASLDALTRIGALECVIVQTCHRVELYVLGERVDGDVLKKFLKAATGSPYPIEMYSDTFAGEDAARHLIYLACGLESIILGENEILHQVEESLRIAEACGSVGRATMLLFRTALNAGRRVRSKTEICRGSVSIGNLVVKSIIEELGTIDGKKLVIIGAGKIGSIVAKSLPKKGTPTVFIANRTFERAEKLAADVGGRAVRFDRLRSTIAEADAIICATSSPHLVLTKEDLESAGCVRSLLIVDVSNPRGVDERIGELQNIRLLDLERLTKIAMENQEARMEAVNKAKMIAEASLSALVKKLDSVGRNVRVAEIMRWAEVRRRQSLEIAFRRGEFTENQRRVLEEFSYALMRDLLMPLVEGKIRLK
ncbi:MAG: glutamyl-tRNA reductase [Candidatus Verstraetearchaeota archaeon]|nr:glutamyl-tRNA reductase [Candidatus Verstraetearchaeota archaeon]